MVKYSTLFIGGFIACCMLLCIQACKDKFSDARYDSTDEIQIMDYLDTREDLSIFREMIDHVGQRNLLKTAGSYTVFAPTNAAFEKLFET